MPLEAKLQNIHKLQKSKIKVSVCTAEDLKKLAKKDNMGSIRFLCTLLSINYCFSVSGDLMADLLVFSVLF